MASAIIFILALMLKIASKPDINKKIREMDNNPYNTIKSNEWYRNHPEHKL